MRGGMVRRALKWVGLALLVLIVVGIAREPLFWKRYFASLVHGPFHPPRSFYQPSETVAGGNEPAPPRVAPEEERIDPAALEAAAEYAAARNSHALIVSRNGHIVFERYWRGTGFDTVESAHSFTKTVTGLLVGIAHAEGRIRSLDEPAANYLPEWRGDARSRITIRNLLQMSSGLEGPDFAFHPWAATIREFLGTDIVAEYMKLPLRGRPGLDWMHQNVDPQMLGVILERATGVRYAQYLSEKLWRPIGAGDAYVWLDRPGGMAHTECCLLARQGDWMRLAEALLHDGVYRGEQVLPRGWVRQMLVPARGNPNYGFQIWLGSPYVGERPYSFERREFANLALEPYATDDVFFLDGFGKYRLWLVPSLGLAILRTGVSPDEPADWDDARIPNLVIRGVRDYTPRRHTGPAVDPAALVPNH